MCGWSRRVLAADGNHSFLTLCVDSSREGCYKFDDNLSARRCCELIFESIFLSDVHKNYNSAWRTQPDIALQQGSRAFKSMQVFVYLSLEKAWHCECMDFTLGMCL